MARKVVVRTKELDSLAVDLYRHIQFAPKLINSKVQSSSYANNTVYTYFMGMKNFVKTGNRNLKQAPNAFYDAVQDCMSNHVAQLTPKEEERVKLRGKYHRTPKTPVKVYREETTTTSNTNDVQKLNISDETMKAIQNANKITCIGIKVGTNIKLFDNQDVLNGYVQCLYDLKPQLTDDIEWQIIDISYKVKP